MKAIIALILVSLCLLQSINGQGETSSIADIISDSANFTTLVKALNATNLMDTLNGTGLFTMFAPDNGAFDKLPPGMLEDLLKPENKERLITILKYHVVGANLTKAEIIGMQLPTQQETLSTESLVVDIDGPSVKLNDATVTTPDVFGSNGIVHIIDRVLLLPTNIVDTATTDNFTILATALTAAGLVDTLKGKGPFTVFAPTDAAFNKLPNGVFPELVKPENKDTLAKILQYHVNGSLMTSPSINRLPLPVNITMLAGGVATLSKNESSLHINDATVTAVDIFNSNGMIHVIDSVLLPTLNIVETAITKGTFSTLVAALKAADLVSTLKGDGPYTVFAPNDAAFAKLPAGVVDELIKTENQTTLAKILKYHVLPRSLSSDVINTMALPANITMLDDSNAVLSKSDNVIRIDGVPIIMADVLNTNGYIHVIDSVILPPLDIVETAMLNGNFKTLVTALKAADLVSTLKGDGPFTVFAPNDAAFDQLPNGTLADLLKPDNKDKLANILKYHVLGEMKSSEAILNMSLPTQITTLSGLKPVVDHNGGSVVVNNVKVITSDVMNTNGIIHILESVLLPPSTIADTAAANDKFKTLMTALNAAGLVETFNGDGSFTVFAPTDAAFAKLPTGVVDELVKGENKDTLSKILKYHVTDSIITAFAIDRLASPANITMLAGGVATLSKNESSVQINDANVTAVDIFNTNGMIQVVDTVILPPLDIVETTLVNGNLKTLVAALKAADLVSTLKGDGPFTVFAPNDAAFAKLYAGVVDDLLKPENKETLGKILKYHVLPKSLSSVDINAMALPANITTVGGNTVVLSKDGDTIKINNIPVIQADLSNTNGYVHVIDSVTLPPLDLVETTVVNGKFKTFVTALRAADLVTTLQGNGPFTVFAPTDEAFDKLPNGTMNDYLQPSKKKDLQLLLKYHVINGRRVLSADLKPSENIAMMDGGSTDITVTNRTVEINNATVILADLGSTNGVIQVIDGVLFPRKKSAMTLHQSEGFLITLMITMFLSYRLFF